MTTVNLKVDMCLLINATQSQTKGRDANADANPSARPLLASSLPHHANASKVWNHSMTQSNMDLKMRNKQSTGMLSAVASGEG